MLDGRFCRTSERVDLFLKRARAFVSNTFVMTYVDRMDGHCLEKVMSFLSSREVALSGVRLHCVQREGSILQKSPWVVARRWDSDAVDAAMQHTDSWKGLVLDKGVIEDVTVVHSPVSGSGKTRWITKNLRQAEDGLKAVTARITIHEQSSLSSLARNVSERVLRREGVKAVHFSISCLPPRGEGRDAWLETVEYFFFSLLVLRECSDTHWGFATCFTRVR